MDDVRVKLHGVRFRRGRAAAFQDESRYEAEANEPGELKEVCRKKGKERKRMTAEERDALIRETGWTLHPMSPGEGACSFWVAHVTDTPSEEYFDLTLEERRGSYRLSCWVECNKQAVQNWVRPIFDGWARDGVQVDLDPASRSIDRGYVCTFTLPGIDPDNLYSSRGGVVDIVNAIENKFRRNGFLVAGWCNAMP